MENIADLYSLRRQIAISTIHATFVPRRLLTPRLRCLLVISLGGLFVLALCCAGLAFRRPVLLVDLELLLVKVCFRIVLPRHQDKPRRGASLEVGMPWETKEFIRKSKTEHIKPKEHNRKPVRRSCQQLSTAGEGC